MSASSFLRLLGGVSVLPAAALAATSSSSPLTPFSSSRSSPVAKCDDNIPPPPSRSSSSSSSSCPPPLSPLNPPKAFSFIAPYTNCASVKFANLCLRLGLVDLSPSSALSGEKDKKEVLVKAEEEEEDGESGKTTSDSRHKQKKRRQKVVIVGSGWAAVSFLERLDLTRYEPVVISPRDYFAFTPLLPSVSVGSLPAASCTTSIRELLLRGGVLAGRFYEGWVEEIDVQAKKVLCRASSSSSSSSSSKTGPLRELSSSKSREQQHQHHCWEEPYDYLVLAAGAEVNTFGIPGVEEHAIFLKEVEDACRIRTRLFDLLEKASLPNVSEEEKKQLLHFVVVGAGPTGVEVAGEIDDFLQTEGKKFFPCLAQYFKVTLVEMLPTVLAAYNKEIQKFALKKLQNNPNMDVQLQARVVRVDADKVTIQAKKKLLKNTHPVVLSPSPSSYHLDKKNEEQLTGRKEQQEEEEAIVTEAIPYGCLIWASGVKSPKLCSKFWKENEKILMKEQKTSPVLLVNQQMKVRGCEDIYALGDCARIKPPALVDYVDVLFDAALKSSPSSKRYTVSSDWLEQEAKSLSAFFPQLSPRKFDFSQKPRIAEMTKEDFARLLKEIDEAYRSPAPTAQNAKQGGHYLALVFNSFPSSEEKILKAPAFVEKYKGSLVYIGQGESAADLPPFGSLLGGWHTLLLWRLVYVQSHLTWFNRLLCVGGWMKESLRGRDVSRSHPDSDVAYERKQK